jgi:hypothetical protein
MMTPKEKAKELVEKMLNQQSNTEEIYDAKQCALIAVDEILQIDCCDMSEKNFNNHIEYWISVQKEIEKL